MSGHDGGFSAPGLTPGDYVVSARVSGRMSPFSTVKVHSGQESQVSVKFGQLAVGSPDRDAEIDRKIALLQDQFSQVQSQLRDLVAERLLAKTYAPARTGPAAVVSARTSMLCAIGGNGREDGWPVSVRSPQDAAAAAHEFLLRDGAVSTSANYEQFRVIAGRQFGHIIDPRTGWPAEGVQSVTVLAPTGTEADSLSTAVFVLGTEDGAELLRRRGLEGFMGELDGTRRIIEIEELLSLA